MKATRDSNMESRNISGDPSLVIDMLAQDANMLMLKTGAIAQFTMVRQNIGKQEN